MSSPVIVKAFLSEGEDSDSCDLKFTSLREANLKDVKEKIKEKYGGGSVILYFRGGYEIRYNDALPLSEIFGDEDAFGDEVQIELDFGRDKHGEVAVSVQEGGQSVKLVDMNGAMKDLRPGTLQTVQLADVCRNAKKQKLTVSKDGGFKDPLDGKRKAVVQEYYLEEDRGSLHIDSTNGGNILEFCEDVPKLPQSGMIWLFEKDSGRFFQSLDPVLPQKSEVNEAFWADHKITGDMVSKALEVCRETYCGDGNEEPLDAEEWSGAAPEDRFVLGGTRCVKTVVGDTLFIGFRGTVSKMDWKSNAQFSLVALEDEDSNVRVHDGFKKRADNILRQHLTALIPVDLPGKIVVTGHSLGAAISQLVYMQLRERMMEQRNLKEFNCEVLNVTFASPLVGNLQFRNRLMRAPQNLAGNMYHFVLDEDIVPAVLFYKHAFEKIPKPSMASRAIGYDKMNVLLTVLNQALGVALESLPPEAQTLDKLSMYEQPVYDQCPEGAMEPYAPAGNYFYLKTTGGRPTLHHLTSHQDPQYVAQALASALKVLRKMGSVDKFVANSALRLGANWVPLLKRAVDSKHPLANKIEKDHGINNYKDKIDLLTSGQNVV